MVSTEKPKFNQSTPWNVRIGSILGADPTKLQLRWGTDLGLDQVVESTCQAVRNAAVKSLNKNNSNGWLLKDHSPFTAELNNLCFGSGFSMWEGKIVATGACGQASNVDNKKTK